jgi:hypothetical protein
VHCQTPFGAALAIGYVGQNGTMVWHTTISRTAIGLVVARAYLSCNRSQMTGGLVDPKRIGLWVLFYDLDQSLRKHDMHHQQLVSHGSTDNNNTMDSSNRELRIPQRWFRILALVHVALAAVLYQSRPSHRKRLQQQRLYCYRSARARCWCLKLIRLMSHFDDKTVFPFVQVFCRSYC